MVSAIPLSSLKKLKFRRGASVTVILKNDEAKEFLTPQASFLFIRCVFFLPPLLLDAAVTYLPPVGVGGLGRYTCRVEQHLGGYGCNERDQIRRGNGRVRKYTQPYDTAKAPSQHHREIQTQRTETQCMTVGDNANRDVIFYRVDVHGTLKNKYGPRVFESCAWISR